MLIAVQYQRADGSWWTGHHGVELKDPQAYQRKLLANGVQARCVPSADCPLCDRAHPAPYDGTCLL